MKKNLLWAICAVAFLASCESTLNDESNDVLLNELTYRSISFSPSIGEMTRVTGSTFDLGDQISVFASTSEQAYAENALYSYDGALFVSDNPIVQSAEALSFYAIYPYSSEAALSFGYEVTTSQTTAEAYEMSDLLVASTEATESANPELKFVHALSGVKVQIVSSDVSLESVSIGVSAMTQVECDVVAGTYVGTGDVQSVEMLSAEGVYTAVVAPQLIAAGEPFLTIVDGEKSYTWASDANYDLASGTQYSCYVTIESGEITLSGDIYDWVDGGLLGGDVVGGDDITEDDGEYLLSEISAESIPSSDKWVITDVAAESTDFAGMTEALLALAESGREIELEFPNMTEFPTYAIFGSTARLSTYDFSALVSLSAPLVTTVNNYAFYDCKNLASIDLPEMVTAGSYSFTNAGVTELKLDKLMYISSDAFYGCSSLVSIDMPEVISVGANAFRTCASLESFNLPKAQTFDNYVFYSCTSLKTATLPSATTLGNYTFRSCESMTSASVPVAMALGSFCFGSCTILTSVDAPLAVTIGASAFRYCSALTSLELPSATSLAAYSFGGCTGLTSLSVATEEGSVMTSLISTTFPDVDTENIDLVLGTDNSSLVSESTLTVGTVSYTFKSITLK